jgi:mannose/fructose/N-acetylgalactosamine-specific phosphotransferase system component IID
MAISSLNATKALSLLNNLSVLKSNALKRANNLGVFVIVKGTPKMTHVKIPVEFLNDIDKAAINTQKFIDGTFDNTSNSDS